MLRLVPRLVPQIGLRIHNALELGGARCFSEGKQNKARNLSWKKRRVQGLMKKRIRNAETAGTRLSGPKIADKNIFFQRDVVVNPFGIPELTSFAPTSDLSLLYIPSALQFEADRLLDHKKGPSSAKAPIQPAAKVAALHSQKDLEDDFDPSAAKFDEPTLASMKLQEDDDEDALELDDALDDADVAPGTVEPAAGGDQKATP